MRPDLESVSQELAATLVETVTSRSARPFGMALTGGRTAARVYDVLGSDAPPQSWSDVDFWWSDERLVPRESPESNYHNAWHRWLQKAGVARGRLHLPDVSEPDAEAVAKGYERDIRRFLGPRLVLDWVLLSLGEDGHVASLFPGSPQARELNRLVVPVIDSPKPPARRITMTLALLRRARQVHVLAVGADKADALQRTLAGPPDVSADSYLPASHLISSTARVVWWADDAAVRILEE